MPAQRSRAWRASSRRLAVARAGLSVATKLGGINNLPASMRGDLHRALGISTPSAPCKPRLRLVVDNTTCGRKFSAKPQGAV